MNKLIIEGHTARGLSKGKVTRFVKPTADLEAEISLVKKQLKVGNGGSWDITVEEDDTTLARVDHARAGFREPVVNDFADIVQA